MQHDLNDTCGALKDLQVSRKFVIKAEVRITNMVTALLARALGYNPHEKEAGEKIWKRAQAAIKREFSGKDPSPDDAEAIQILGADIGAMRSALQPIKVRRDEIESDMIRLARLVPLGTFIEETRGFDLIGLAVIVGEAGNLSNYPNVAKLWRRLGYGMAKGHEAKAYSTWRLEGGLDADDWTSAGYSPKRLGQIYGVVTVPLFMSKAKNKYGEVYTRRRAHTAVTHPDWTKGHSDNDARRVMTKALLADLWSAWRRAMEILETTACVPSAEIQEATFGMKSRGHLLPEQRAT
jgi:hypothetical protein